MANVSTDQQLCLSVAQGVPILHHSAFHIVAGDQHFDRVLGFKYANFL